MVWSGMSNILKAFSQKIIGVTRMNKFSISVFVE